ncbi:hypothetical protein [Candidatus Parabeggiatoa sp. HSG14]|uniref:hypothetical protein n=1 Tax=Candidatus Parabeggiatoa sp. HSG14 TaxID=3055593 RepID=UPI0025A7BA49|nr:hypothetical protein [Thiotrichales bacterium HSG14]
MFKIKLFLVCIVMMLQGFTPRVIYAESVKIVQWWDSYMPEGYGAGTGNGWYRGDNGYSIQKQDLNGDEVYNDTLVFYTFSMSELLTPPFPSPNSGIRDLYRIDLPSAKFYGGVLARFTNVSHVTKKDRKGKKIPMFDRFQQTTVQWDGAAPCCYSEEWPQNMCRGFPRGVKGTKWFDITVMVVNKGGENNPFSEAFQKRKKATLNFTAVFVWKKEDFINGGALVDKIIFDESSKLSLDLTRFRKNVEECRFVVQDGDQFWISEFAPVVTDLPPSSIELNPLDSRWAIYTPSNADNDEDIQKLLKMLEDDPKALEDKDTKKMVDDVNKMTFDSKTATFTNHVFKDVQAVGAYFATNEFTHQTTQLVFDNFQAFATSETGKFPESKAIAISPDNDSSVDITGASFKGGVSFNDNASEQIARFCADDTANIKGDITVPEKHIGKAADIVAVAAYQLSRKKEDADMVEFFMLDKNGGAMPWDVNINNLVALQENIILQSKQTVPIYSGPIGLPGFFRLFFGYRLHEEGHIVFGADTIDLRTYQLDKKPTDDE